MALFEVQGPDGKTYEVDAPSMEAAAEAIGSFGAMPAGGSSVNTAAVSEFRDKGRALATGMANGASFGFADNIAGLIEGGKEVLQGRDFGGGYDYGVGMAREGMAMDEAANPGLTTTGNIAGMAIPALIAAPLATGGNMLGTAIRGGVIGGGEGGLQGAGYADGNDTAGQALRGLLIGGGVGIAAPALIGGLGAVKNAIKDPITGLTGIASKAKANRAVAEALARSGKTPADLDAMTAAASAAGQSEFRMVDALGLPGQRMASGMVRAGGAPGDEVAEFLATRQAGQGERVGAFVEDAFDGGGTTAAKTRDGLVAARSSAADTAYDAARGNAAPVDVRGALGVIDARTGGMTGSGVTGDGIDAKLAGYRSRLAAQPGPDGVMRELSDFDRVLGVKQAVQDDIGAAVRAGRNNEARELGKLVIELDAALEGSSDMYRTANDGFRAASRVIDAVDDGATMAARGRAADNVPKFGAMAAAEQDAARVGYGDRLLTQLDNIASPTSNRAKPLQTPKRVAEADAMATDAQLYADRLGRENTMWETQNRALGGSRTADNLADQEAMEGAASGAMGAVRSAANLQFGDMVSKVVGALGPIAKGQNEATRSLIVQALISGNPMQTLAPVLAQSGKSASVRRILEALVRQPMREGGESVN